MGVLVLFIKHVLNTCCMPGPGKMAGATEVKKESQGHYCLGVFMLAEPTVTMK